MIMVVSMMHRGQYVCLGEDCPLCEIGDSAERIELDVEQEDVIRVTPRARLREIVAGEQQPKRGSAGQ